jgi:hypothetical protein
LSHGSFFFGSSQAAGEHIEFAVALNTFDLYLRVVGHLGPVLGNQVFLELR